MLPLPTKHDRVEVCGVFRAVDAKHENIVISNLDSGIGVVPTALVRWSDILSITTITSTTTTTTTTDDDEDIVVPDETKAAA